jgi:hypothetical protein
MNGRGCLVAALVFAFALSPAYAASLPRESRVPGGIALIQVPGGDVAPTALVDARRAAVVRDGERWVAIVGIPLSAQPGPQVVKVATSEGTLDVPFRVVDKRYRTQHLTIKNPRQVTPAPEDLQRIEQ